MPGLSPQLWMWVVFFTDLALLNISFRLEGSSAWYPWVSHIDGWLKQGIGCSCLTPPPILATPATSHLLPTHSPEHSWNLFSPGPMPSRLHIVKPHSPHPPTPACKKPTSSSTIRNPPSYYLKTLPHLSPPNRFPYFT